MAKAKKVNVEFIAPENELIYAMLTDLIDKFHPQLKQANIGLAWRKSVKSDVDGRLVLGKCQRVSDLQREFTPMDFIIQLNQEVWTSPEFDEAKKRALLDHELCHAEVKLTDEGQAVIDERNRIVFRMRKHDLEEFREIVDRHGLYKQDLQKFAESILRKKAELEPA